MASVVLGRRSTTVARQTTDRTLLRAFLGQDRLYAAYAICDLEEREFRRTRWGAAFDGRRARRGRSRVHRPDAAAAVRDGQHGRHRARSCATSSAPVPRTSRRRSDMLPAIETQYRVDAGPQMVRMWVDRAHFRPVSGDRPAAVAGRDRRAQPAVPARLRLVAPVELHRRRRLLRVARQRPARRRRRYARHQPGRSSRGRRQRADPHGLPWPRVRDGRHRRRHRRAAAELRPGRAQRPGRQSAGHQRLPPPRLCRARPLRGATRSIGSAHRGPTSRRRCGASSPARRSTADDRPDHAARPRPDRPRTRVRGRAPDRMGRARDAGAAPDPRAVRARPAARRPAGRGVPPRHDRDGQPHAHAQGRRRRGRARRVEPALDEGRRRRGARRRVRHPDVRPARRGPRHLLRAPQRGRRHASPDHDGRRLRPGVAAPQRASRAGQGGPCRDRGDDDRRHPPQGDGRRRRPRVPGRGRQRGPDQAPVRQPLRHGPVDGRRHRPGHQHAHRGSARRHRRLRLGRQGHRRAHGRPRRPRRGRRGRPGPGARGADGRLRRHDPHRGRPVGRAVRHRHRQPQRLPARALRGDARRRGDGQLRPLRRRARPRRAARAGRGPRARGPRERPGVRPRRQEDPPHRRGPTRQPGRRRGPPGRGHGHELREPGAVAPSTSPSTTASSSRRCTSCPRRSTPRSPASSWRRWASSSSR